MTRKNRGQNNEINLKNYFVSCFALHRLATLLFATAAGGGVGRERREQRERKMRISRELMHMQLMCLAEKDIMIHKARFF